MTQSNDNVATAVSNNGVADGKLKSTTVRFTKQDIQIIDALRRRLGLGMVQVIRVAIRRLAQLEKYPSLL